MLCGKFLLPITFVPFVFSSAYSLSDFCLLHCQCANCKLAMSDGCPFLFTGTMWSMTGLNGWGYLRSLSTGWPHIPQVFLVFKIIFLFFSKATLCGPLRSARRGLVFVLGGGAFLFNGGGWYSQMYPLGIFQSRGVFSAPTPSCI